MSDRVQRGAGALEVAAAVARTFGLRRGALRAAFELRRKVGLFRSEPRHAPASVGRPLGRLAVPPLEATDPLAPAMLERARRVREGEYERFGWDWVRLPTTAEDWSTTHAGGVPWPLDPWWTLSLVREDGADVKDAWEPARFGWSNDLVRGYAITRDEGFVRAFVAALLSWRAACPPFRGIQWACGQESSLRAIALLHAEATFADSGALTDPDRRALVEVLGWTGERVADALGYAVSQRNNHGVSESAGLVLLGERLRGVHPEATAWRRRGMAVLTAQLRDQIADDGWYVQHSFNYLRLMLDVVSVVQRVTAGTPDALPADVVERVRRALHLLATVARPEDGVPPLHGPNDGALLRPGALADYRDVRPSITGTRVAFGWCAPDWERPDPETLAWLGAPAPERCRPAEPPAVQGGVSGWVVARRGPTRVFTRAVTYRSRPGHFDTLHVSLTHGARDVIVDPGSYRYNAPPPWKNPFVGPGAHNGPVLPGEGDVRAPRSVRVRWPEGELVGTREQDGAVLIRMARAPGVRREVELREGEMVVRDTLREGEGETGWSWCLAPGIGVASLEASGCDVREGPATEDGPAGWSSPYYARRDAGRFLLTRARLSAGSTLVHRFTVVPSPDGVGLAIEVGPGGEEPPHA